MWLILNRVFGWVLDWVIKQFNAIRTLGDWAITQLLAGLSHLFPTVSWTSVQSYMDQLNYVFPLSEAVVMGSALLALWIGVWLYKAVKSWIPTVSGA